ncbi:MAG: hypothetical protein IVW57_00540 [Ktedonobacterales bacterium]|nr:hypothetical protein [Ktedonobacterales bacterium]
MSTSTTSETHTFTTDATPTLIARNRAGAITVAAGTDGQIGLRVTKKARNGILGFGGAHDLERIQIHTAREGDTITVEVEYPAEVSEGITVELAFIVPTHTALDLRLAAGNLGIREVTGQVRAVAHAGNLAADDVTFADGSTLTVTAGNAEIHGALAADASLDIIVTAGQANVELPARTAATLEASVDVGRLHLSGFSIPVRANSCASGPVAPFSPARAAAPWAFTSMSAS